MPVQVVVKEKEKRYIDYVRILYESQDVVVVEIGLHEKYMDKEYSGDFGNTLFVGMSDITFEHLPFERPLMFAETNRYTMMVSIVNRELFDQGKEFQYSDPNK